MAKLVTQFSARCKIPTAIQQVNEALPSDTSTWNNVTSEGDLVSIILHLSNADINVPHLKYVYITSKLSFLIKSSY